MEFKNVEVFEEFIKRNVKADYYDMEEYKKDLINKAYEGNTFYELGSHETKSKHAESISFDYAYEYDEELDERTYEAITF